MLLCSLVARCYCMKMPGCSLLLMMMCDDVVDFLRASFIGLHSYTYFYIVSLWVMCIVCGGCPSPSYRLIRGIRKKNAQNKHTLNLLHKGYMGGDHTGENATRPGDKLKTTTTTETRATTTTTTRNPADATRKTTRKSPPQETPLTLYAQQLRAATAAAVAQCDARVLRQSNQVHVSNVLCVFVCFPITARLSRARCEKITEFYYNSG